MNKRLAICAVALVFVAGMCLAAEKGKAGSWAGEVTDTHCGTKGHMGNAGDCVKKCVGMGAKYALLSEGKVYVLDAQDKAAAHAGHKVTVKGTIAGDTIKVASIEMAAEPKAAGAKKKTT